MLVNPLTRAVTDAVAAGQCVSPDPGRDSRVIYDYVFACLRTVLIFPGVSDDRTTEHLVGFALRALQAA